MSAPVNAMIAFNEGKIAMTGDVLKHESDTSAIKINPFGSFVYGQ